MAWLHWIREHLLGQQTPEPRNQRDKMPGAEPDIGGEYGHNVGDQGNVGGAGFEDDKFQRTV